MEIHNPPKLKLPPLMIEKNTDRAAMEKNAYVLNFVKSNLLLNKDYYLLFQDIQRKSGEIEEIIQLIENENFHYTKIQYAGSSRTGYVMIKWPTGSLSAPINLESTGPGLRRHIRENLLLHAVEIIENGDEQTKTDMNMLLSQILPEYHKKAIDRIVKLSQDIQNSLSKFEQAYKIDLDILIHVTVYVCKECSKVVSRNKFLQCLCSCGSKISTVSDTLQTSIALFGLELQNFISKNYWFEYGIDHILRKKNFQTLCGYYVLGHSGTAHEIDNIAESRSSNLRFFGECKVGEVGANDIFILAGKMSDIGFSRGYIFTLTKTIPKELSYLARSKNISIVTNVLEKSVADLEQEIRE